MIELPTLSGTTSNFFLKERCKFGMSTQRMNLVFSLQVSILAIFALRRVREEYCGSVIITESTRSFRVRDRVLIFSLFRHEVASTLDSLSLQIRRDLVLVPTAKLLKLRLLLRSPSPCQLNRRQCCKHSRVNIFSYTIIGTARQGDSLKGCTTQSCQLLDQLNFAKASAFREDSSFALPIAFTNLASLSKTSQYMREFPAACQAGSIF
ncbi:hypothetical protein PsorP6_011168 [Peronosclerospora sorghi]|uniref:Uncharacterized protein n=1 Tax=Peronosclerospora sorghi TaxID=230839 RepID=A0ACC0VWW6_9STRA|nr:hypothetical protein PsorP6_011168 [Peronosclerospora sorghi]